MRVRNVVLSVLTGAFLVLGNIAFIVHEHYKPFPDVYKAQQTNDATYEDGLPRVLYIAGARWNVEIGTHDEMLDAEEAYGVTFCKEHVILMHSHMLRSNEIDTLIHESLHGFVCRADGSLDNDYYSRTGGHRAIALFSQYWMELMTTNPELAHFILDRKP